AYLGFWMSLETFFKAWSLYPHNIKPNFIIIFIGKTTSLFSTTTIVNSKWNLDTKVNYNFAGGSKEILFKCNQVDNFYNIIGDCFPILSFANASEVVQSRFLGNNNSLSGVAIVSD
ncbi:hypothetical protein ACJX0J_020782, partial [Zea mays]